MAATAMPPGHKTGRNKKMKKVGIIGGLGPETSCKLCLDLNIELRKSLNQQPNLVMSNIALTKHSENNVVNGKVDEVLRAQLIDAVKDLNNAGVDLLVIPCNTVHIHIDELRKVSNKPILSIIEECADVCKKNNLKKVGILGTNTTIKQGLHQNKLNQRDIQSLIQKKIAKTLCQKLS